MDFAVGQREKAAGVKRRKIETEEEEEEEELVMGLGRLVMMMLKAQKRVISPTITYHISIH